MGKESVLKAMYGSLECDPNRIEPNVVKIAALARTTPLGRELWHLAAGQNSPRAISLLVKEMRRQERYSMVLCARIAEHALYEHLYPQCRSCGGETEVMVGQKKETCPTCQGSGVHRFSDAERGLAIGEKMNPGLSKIMQLAIAIISDHDRMTRRVVAVELEK